MAIVRRLQFHMRLYKQLVSPRMTDSMEREGERNRQGAGGGERRMKGRVSGEKCTKDESHGIFYNIILEMISHLFLHILLVTKTSSTVVEGDYTGCGYQEARIIVGYPGSWPAPYFTKRKNRKKKQKLYYIQMFIIKHLNQTSIFICKKCEHIAIILSTQMQKMFPKRY